MGSCLLQPTRSKKARGRPNRGEAQEVNRCIKTSSADGRIYNLIYLFWVVFIESCDRGSQWDATRCVSAEGLEQAQKRTASQTLGTHLKLLQKWQTVCTEQDRDWRQPDLVNPQNILAAGGTAWADSRQNMVQFYGFLPRHLRFGVRRRQLQDSKNGQRSGGDTSPNKLRQCSSTCGWPLRIYWLPQRATSTRVLPFSGA